MSDITHANAAIQKPIAKKISELYFLAVFVCCYTVLHALYFLVPDDILRDTFHHYCIVLISADIINYFAPLEHVTTIENRLVSTKANLSVVRGCDGAGASFLLIAAIVAFRAKLSNKIVGLLAGVVLLYLINQVRIIGLYFVVAYEKEWFLPIHTYFAPTLIIILSSLFFAWWAFKSANSNNKNVAAEAASY